MDEGGGDAGDAGDGYNQASVALDALHHALGTLENSSGHTDLLALKEFAVHLVESNEALLGGGCDEHEITHLPFVYGLRLFAFRVTIEVERTRIVLNQSVYILPCAADEEDIGHYRRNITLHTVSLDGILDPGTIFDHLRGIPVRLLIYCFHLDLLVQQTLPPFHSI